jgi:hypothetical protein
MRRLITPPELARRYGVSPEKIITWIRSGELHAVDLATKLGGRPRYAISEEDIVAFEGRRAVVPPAPVIRRKRQHASGVINFF